MTIEEVLKRVKDKMACDYHISGCDTCNISSCEDRDIIIQLSELFEELKELRKMREDIESNANALENNGYNKAIDDFKAECHKQISKNHEKYGFNQRDLVNLDLSEIDMLAEQLKGGADNDD